MEADQTNYLFTKCDKFNYLWKWFNVLPQIVFRFVDLAGIGRTGCAVAQIGNSMDFDGSTDGVQPFAESIEGKSTPVPTHRVQGIPLVVARIVLEAKRMYVLLQRLVEASTDDVKFVVVDN